MIPIDLCELPVSSEDFNRLPDYLYTVVPQEVVESIKQNGLGNVQSTGAGVDGRKGFFLSADPDICFDYAEGIHSESTDFVQYAVNTDDLKGKLFYDTNDYDTATFVAEMTGREVSGDYDYEEVEEMEQEYPSQSERAAAAWRLRENRLCFFAETVLPFDKIEEV